MMYSTKVFISSINDDVTGGSAPLT
eukprot:COSAG01_NODE_26472_length_713_cov_0.785016_1_plen_24_part_10